MTEGSHATADMLAAKIAIYERTLRALVHLAPNAKEIEDAVSQLIADWEKEFPERHTLLETAMKTRSNIFRKPDPPQN